MRFLEWVGAFLAVLAAVTVGCVIAALLVAGVFALFWLVLWDHLVRWT